MGIDLAANVLAERVMRNDPKTSWPTSCGMAVVLLALNACRPMGVGLETQYGVVVEEIGPGTALEAAGLQPGDLLLAWERLAQPPANPEGARGEIGSVFDWAWLVMEQAPRGTMVLSGERDGQRLAFQINPGAWESKVRPRLPQGLLDDYRPVLLESKRESIEGKDPRAASRLWAKLAETAEDSGDWRLSCGLSLHMAQIWAQERDWERAEAALRLGLDQVRDERSRAHLLDQLGEVYQRQTLLEEAEESHASALAIRKRLAPDSLQVATSLSHAARVAFRRGDLDRADESFERSLEIRQRLAPHSLGVAESLNNLGMVALARGEPEPAAGYLERALALKQRLVPDGLSAAGTLNNLGIAAEMRGDFDRAEVYKSRAHVLRERLAPRSLDLAASWNNLGVLAEYRGDLDRAEDYLARALEVFEEVEPDAPSVAAALANLGMLANDRSAPERAIDYLDRALAIQERIAPEGLDVARILSHRGIAAEALGDLDQATADYERAFAIRERLAPGGREVATSLIDLGIAASLRQDQDQAWSYLNRARAIYEEAEPESINTASALHNLGTVATLRKDFDLAAQYHTRALAIRQRLVPKSRAVAESFHALGSVARAKQDLALAAESFRLSVEALESQLARLGGSHEVRGGFLARNRGFYRDFIEVEVQRKRLQEAFAILERSRTRSFLEMLSERDLIFSSDLPEDLERKRRRLGVELDRVYRGLVGLSPERDAAQIKSIHGEIRRIERHRESIIEKIRTQSPHFDALQYPQPLGFRQTQRSLDSGTVTLSYSVGEETTDLFVLSTQGDLQVETLPMGEKGLRRAVGEFRDLIQEARPGDETGARRSLLIHGARLYQQLIHPAIERVGKSERILVIPDGPLHLLPWGAVIRDLDQNGNDETRSWQYLAEWKPLHLALSATVYAQLKAGRPLEGEFDDAGRRFFLAAFGDPYYPPRLRGQATQDPGVDVYVRSAAERGFDFRALPYTRREVEQISALYPQGETQTYLGAEATEERVKSVAGHARVLHFATHGHLDDLFPLNSAVVLAMPQDFGEDRDNGLLQVWEIFERIRLDAELVVLSACESGLGKEQDGEGLIGLTRAFHYAGARSVAATLWSVNDQATAQLMLRFYRHLGDGKSKAEALSAAQRELIQGPIWLDDEEGRRVKRDRSLPYYWAAFQIYGDWQ